MLATRKFAHRWLKAIGAMPVLILLVACGPPGPRALLDGEKLLREGKAAQAVEKFKAAAEIMPRSPLAWHFLGLAFQSGGRADEAERAYEKALELDRNLAAARYNLGVLQMERGNFAAAAGELATYTVFQPQSLDAWKRLGMAQFRAGRLDDAEKAFQSALKLQPGSPEILNMLALIQVQRKKPREAALSLQNALQRQPQYAPAILNLAILWQQQFNNRALAMQKYREYLALIPPPQNRAEVEEILKQLEAEISAKSTTNLVLAPRPAPVTNRISPVQPSPEAQPAVSKPKPLVSAPKVVVSNAPSLAAATVAAPENPAKTPTATAPPPPVKTEVVELKEEPQPKAAKDVRTEEKAASIPSPPRETQPESKAPASPERVEPSLVRKVTPEPKSGLLDRINPMRLFRGKETNKAPAKASVQKEIPLPPVENLRPAANLVPVRTAEVRPVPWAVIRDQQPGPRYAYRQPAKPGKGNRSEAEKYFNKGWEAQKQRRWGVALEAYREAARYDPGYFDAYYNEALAAYQARDWARALLPGEYALAINPASTDARYNFALALQEAGYKIDAVNEFNKIVERAPGEVRAHLSLGNLYAQEFTLSGLARQHYRKVLELSPQHPYAAHIRYWLNNNQ